MSEKRPDLTERFSETEAQDITFGLSEDWARKRHDDYEEVVAGHEFTQEQAKEVVSGDFDPAEKAYEIAKSGGHKLASMEDILSGDAVVDAPEPGSAKDVYG